MECSGSSSGSNGLYDGAVVMYMAAPVDPEDWKPGKYTTFTYDTLQPEA